MRSTKVTLSFAEGVCIFEVRWWIGPTRPTPHENKSWPRRRLGLGYLPISPSLLASPRRLVSPVAVAREEEGGQAAARVRVSSGRGRGEVPAMALKFLNKKGWHTGSLRNIERVWKAEQAEEAERRKTEELKKQVAAEKEKAEFRAMQERAGLRP